MKKIMALCTLCFCLAGVVNTTQAQQHQNVIKINPLSLTVGNISLTYERAVSQNKSFLIHGAYWLGFSYDDVKMDGFTISPEFRFYVTSHGVPEGFYVAPYGRYQSITGRYTNDNNVEETATYSRIGAGVNIGYQFLFGERVTLDLFIGPKYLTNKIKYSDGASEDELETGLFDKNFGGRWGVTVGYAF